VEKTNNKIGKIAPQSRMTNQRLEIISYLQSTKEHPNAEKIYIEIKKKLPKISLGTIYRNLEFLQKKNLIKKLNFGEDKDRFDGDTSVHHHFYCLRCRRVIDLALPDAYQLAERVVNSHNVEVSEFSIIFKGRCNICK
jgi:Fe2+ or Zn2+ uptake regulation protein